MKKITIAALVFVPVILLNTGCSVRATNYYPSNDYVYTVGNYGYSPFWGTYSTGWGNAGYWRGYRGVSTRGVWWR